MNCHYKILPHYSLIIQKIEGDISISDSIEMTRNEFADAQYNVTYNILVDMRNFKSPAKTQNHVANVEVFTEFLKQNSTHSNALVSIIISEPLQAVIIELFKNKISELPFNISIFTTLEAALEYLHLQQKIQDISQELAVL